MARPTPDALAAAHAARDWTGLWGHGLPLVPLILRIAARRFKADPPLLDEDALQQARLCVGESVRAWDPEKGPFRTWVLSTSVDRMLDWLRAQRNRGLTPRAARADIDDLDAPVSHPRGVDEPPLEFDGIESLVYPAPPRGFGDPFDELDRGEREEARALAMATLDPGLRRLLAAFWGLDDAEPMTLADIARREGISVRTLRYRLETARTVLRKRMEDR